MPIRDLGNKFAFSSSNTHLQQSFELPTILPSNYTEMDITAGYSPDKYDEVKGRTFLPKLQVSKDSSMSSTKSLVTYHDKIECNNALNEDVNMNNNSSVLLYKTSQEKAIQVSKAANPYNNILNKHVSVNHNTMTL